MSDSPFLNNPEGRRDENANLPPGFGVSPPQQSAGGEESPSIPGRGKPVDDIVEELSRVPAPKPPADLDTSKVKVKKEESKHDDSIAGIVDTFEAIIIALILALTFRAFVVEAFVIPTGSMAPTLLGAHFDVICPKCGFHFAENADLSHQKNAARELVDATAIYANRLRYCPNCGYEIEAKQLPDIVDAKAPAGNPENYKAYPFTNNGDRILVMKYLYSIASPQRYDVIVFKEPSAVRDNYIKRLIGLPGETIEIIDGNIYIGEGDAGQNDPSQRFIQRKPRHIQDALWQIVYDNDFHPIDEGWPRPHHVPHNDPERVPDDQLLPPEQRAWVNPWAGKGWETDPKNPTVMLCNDTAPSTLAFLSDDHLEKNPTLAFYTCNILGYNSVEVYKANSGGRIPVGDLHLETVWTPRVDAQPISILLGKPFNQWRATISAAGEVTLDRREGEKFVTKTTAHVTAPRANVPIRLALDNVDHAVEFYVDGALVAEAAEKWSAADAVANRQHESRQPRAKIEITTTGKLEHLKLMRDLYYTQAATSSEKFDPNDGVNRGMNNTGPASGSYGHPITLGPDEFFALGDNSTSSADGRMWDRVVPALDDLGTRPGIVPRRYLLGKAFFVYWPAGYRFTNKLNLPIVPNAGDMRLIR